MVRKLNIVLDANAAVLRTGATHLSGIGRTVLGLAKAFDGLVCEEIDIRLMIQTFRGSIPAQFDKIKISNIRWPIGNKFDWVKAQFPLIDRLVPHDLLHVPANYAKVYRPKKALVTIHDAMFFSYPEEHLGHSYSRAHVPRFARACRSIATCSNSSKSDIVKYLAVPPEKVKVIPWGVDRSIFNDLDKIGASLRVGRILNSSRPYMLSVSCSIGRKNTVSVLRAFKMALDRGVVFSLVLVWGNPPEVYLQEFSKEIEERRIRFIKHVDDQLLGDLYAGATLTLFPSKYEGFGLPILESMACGTPVLTCRNSSLVEVGGDAAIYVKPDDLELMADIITSFNSSADEDYASLCELSLNQASKFTWTKTARNYMEWYIENAQL